MSKSSLSSLWWKVWVWVFGLLAFPAGLFAESRKVTFACVDCYSSASLYPRMLSRNFPDVEAKWILIQTHPYDAGREKDILSFPPDSQRLVFDASSAESLESILSVLRETNVVAVLGGMDEGSYHASLFNHHLNLPDNSVATRDSRKLKDEMARALDGLIIPTHKLESAESALKFLSDFPGSDVVVKLNAGAFGSEMRFFRRNDPELSFKLEEYSKRKPIGPFGHEDYFIVQPRIYGPKYYYNTYTYEGTTVNTGISEYYQLESDERVDYFVDTLLDLKSDIAIELLPLAIETNNRTGVTRGNAHLEFIKDKNTGRNYVLETNVRVAGAGIPALENAVYGMSQMELHLFSILDPERLRQELAQYPRARQKNSLLLVMPTPFSGKLREEGLLAMEGLGAFFRPADHYRLNPGSEVKQKPGQDNVLGLFHFLGTRSELKRDAHQAVDILESPGLLDNASALNCRELTAGLAGRLRQRLTEVRWDALRE